VAAPDGIVTKFESKDKNVTIVGLNEAGAHMNDRMSRHLGAGH
jgi:hypothetical protein